MRPERAAAIELVDDADSPGAADHGFGGRQRVRDILRDYDGGVTSVEELPGVRTIMACTSRPRIRRHAPNAQIYW